MTNFQKINKNIVISIISWIIIVLIYTLLFNFLPIGSYIVSISFLLANLFLCLFPKKIKLSMPMIIYRLTGFVRYVALPNIMYYQKISYSYSSKICILMILELVAILIGASIFNKKNKNNIVLEKKEDNKINIASKVKLGLPSVIIIAIGIVLIFNNKAFIERYLILNTERTTVIDISGGISILLSCFFLLSFIYLLKFIKNTSFIPDFLKVLLSVGLGVLYVKGSSISGSSISRWSMLISSIISYFYIIRLYPNYKKRMSLLMVAVLMFSVTFASIMKFTWNDNYSTVEKTVEEELKFATLNAYFSGPKNMQIALELKKDIEKSNMSKFKIFISDTFGNFPLLNNYLSDEKIRSVELFNYKYYGSSISKDQIIPYSNQLYNYFSVFFVLIETVFVYLALFFYYKYKEENNFLNIFCCIYISFFLSLTNCINYSIIMQSLWIHVLPVYLLSLINSKMIITRSNKKMINKAIKG